MEVLWENMSRSFRKRKLRNRFSWPVLVHVRSNDWFSHITMSIGSHCENQVENHVMIREPPNTGMDPWPTVLKNQRTSNDPEPWFSKNTNLPWTMVHIKELLHTRLDFGPFELQSVQMTFPQQEMYQKNRVFYEHSKYVMDSAMAHSRAELVFPTVDSKWCPHWQFKWNGQNKEWNQQMTTSPT